MKILCICSLALTFILGFLFADKYIELSNKIIVLDTLEVANSGRIEQSQKEIEALKKRKPVNKFFLIVPPSDDAKPKDNSYVESKNKCQI
jgi:hypothetical protein